MPLAFAIARRVQVQLVTIAPSDNGAGIVAACAPPYLVCAAVCVVYAAAAALPLDRRQLRFRISVVAPRLCDRSQLLWTLALAATRSIKFCEYRRVSLIVPDYLQLRFYIGVIAPPFMFVRWVATN